MDKAQNSNTKLDPFSFRQNVVVCLSIKLIKVIFEGGTGNVTPKDQLVIVESQDKDKVNIANVDLPLSKENEDRVIDEIRQMFETHDFTAAEYLERARAEEDSQKRVSYFEVYFRNDVVVLQ